MENNIRKIIFKFSVFLTVLCLFLLLIVERDSAQYVVIILSIGINIILLSMIWFISWLENRNDKQSRQVEGEKNGGKRT